MILKRSIIFLALVLFLGFESSDSQQAQAAQSAQSSQQSSQQSSSQQSSSFSSQQSKSSSSSSSTSTTTTYTEEKVSSFTKCSEYEKTTAGQSFKTTCPPGYAISGFDTYSEKTSSGKTDVTYRFKYKKVSKKKAHSFVKRRCTKFAKASSTSEISCKDDESLCGMISDYDKAAGERLYSFQCCDNANAKSDNSNTEEKIETVDLKSGSAHECKASKSTQVIKSMKIVSMSQSSITYSIKYCKYKSCKSRFKESTTTKEYCNKKTAGSGSAGKDNGKKKKGDDKGKKGKSGKKDKSGKGSGKKGSGGKKG